MATLSQVAWRLLHTTTPSSRNELMPRISFQILFAALLLAPALASAQDFDPAGTEAMFAQINVRRAENDLAPLSRHEGLDAAARTHCADMATQQQLTHVSESSGTPADRVRGAGVEASNASMRRMASAESAQACSRWHTG